MVGKWMKGSSNDERLYCSGSDLVKLEKSHSFSGINHTGSIITQ